ncbi:hypothetical protein [Streptomyces sulfonofaciens]|uniref:hypothetical protein n=1 Tax=Streptomyces sulfonofaciens TaxID=68272 RepID=UPI00167AC27F|nr:hypothetical protein [Streptomyces sulfonofaciens]
MQKGEALPRRVFVHICCTAKVGHLTPFHDWSNDRGAARVPEPPACTEEFIGSDEEDPGLLGEVLLREDELPGPDTAVCGMSPPMAVRACLPGPRGCATHV